MNLTLLERPLFEVAGHSVSFLGLLAFAGLFTAGMLVARVLQSNFVRRFFARFKIDSGVLNVESTNTKVRNRRAAPGRLPMC